MTISKRIFRDAVAIAAVLSATSLGAGAQDMPKARAMLATPDGAPAGEVEFTGTPSGVLIEVLAANLSPGTHGIHLHETGDCSASDFTSAGGHYAPAGNEHGFYNENGPHAGDLPNIFVSADGAVSAHFLNDRVTLGEGDGSLFDDDGTAVIVHELPDTYTAEAGAGGRVACGVVERYLDN